MLKICINDVLVRIFKQIYSLKFNKSFIRISVILKQSINFLIKLQDSGKFQRIHSSQYLISLSFMCSQRRSHLVNDVYTSDGTMIGNNRKSFSYIQILINRSEFPKFRLIEIWMCPKLSKYFHFYSFFFCIRSFKW